MQIKRPSRKTCTPARGHCPQTGHACDELMVTAAFLGVVIAWLYGAFSAEFFNIRATREKLCTSRIVMEKAESLRLFTAKQICDTNNCRKPLFVEPYDPRGVTGDPGRPQYVGYASAAGPAGGDLPNAGRPNMRPVTVTLYWTNYIGAKPVVHSRQMQTRLARNGMPKYVWGAL